MATRTDTQSPAPHVADSHDLIRVQGARVNNLKDISVEIPKRRLTVLTGVSGLGKSSLVFGTIADPPGMIGRHEDRLPQAGVAPLGRAAVPPCCTGGVERGDQPAEGTNPGKGSEAVRVSEPTEDLRTEDGPDTRHRDEDAFRVGLGKEDADTLIQVLELLTQVQCQPRLDRDVLRELPVVELIAPQLQGPCCGLEQRLGPVLAPEGFRIHDSPVAEPPVACALLDGKRDRNAARRLAIIRAGTGTRPGNTGGAGRFARRLPPQVLGHGPWITSTT